MFSTCRVVTFRARRGKLVMGGGRQTSYWPPLPKNASTPLITIALIMIHYLYNIYPLKHITLCKPLLIYSLCF